MSILFKVFDCEAYDWNRLYAIGIYDGINVSTFISKDSPNNDFVEWLLESLENKDVVYAHYGGRYDFLFIFDYINSNSSCKLTFIKLIHSSIACFRIRYKGKLIEFRDSFNILPDKLERLTNDFNVVHKKLTLDYELGMDDDRFKEYFNNDLIGLYEVLIEANELTAHLTIASNAIHKYISDFYSKITSIPISRNNNNIDMMFRSAYSGGRVEIFKMVGENLNYYDVNSLYPYVMRHNKYPLLHENNYESVDYFDANSIGIYNVMLRSPDSLSIPLLSYKHEGKLLFPLGSWNGYYTSSELKKASSLGYEYDVINGWIFNECDYIFNDYIDYYYDIKRHSIGSKKAIAKLMLNSLYGKFGQRRDFIDYKISKEENGLRLMNMAFLPINKKDTFSKYLHSEVAAMITANARLALYELFERAGFDNVYYCDTDSIITSTLLNTSDGLGDIKEEARIDKYIAIAPKVYAYTSKDSVCIKAKGLRNTSISFKDFEDAIYDKNLNKFVSEFERLASFKEHIIRHTDNYSSKLKINRKLAGIYDKRIIKDDLTTTPLIIKNNI